MNFPKISKRLLCAASFAQNDEFIADVGTDHAYLPIYLYTKKIIRGAVVSDINGGKDYTVSMVCAAPGIHQILCDELQPGLS